MIDSKLHFQSTEKLLTGSNFHLQQDVECWQKRLNQSCATVGLNYNGNNFIMVGTQLCSSVFLRYKKKTKHFIAQRMKVVAQYFLRTKKKKNSLQFMFGDTLDLYLRRRLQSIGRFSTDHWKAMVENHHYLTFTLEANEDVWRYNATLVINTNIP